MLRATNPIVATYARVEAVDVRISAVGADDVDGRRTSSRRPRAVVLERLGSYVWATGETTWSEAIGARAGRARLDAGGRRDRDGRERRRAVRRRAVAPLRRVDRARCAGGDGARPGDVAAAPTTPMTPDDDASPMTSSATRGARASSAAPRSGSPFAHGRGPGTPRCRSRSRRPTASVRVRRVVFLTGPMGRSRVGARGGRDPARGAGRGRAGRLTARRATLAAGRRRQARAGP